MFKLSSQKLEVREDLQNNQFLFYLNNVNLGTMSKIRS